MEGENANKPKKWGGSDPIYSQYTTFRPAII